MKNYRCNIPVLMIGFNRPENIARVLDELDWFQKKFDYRYHNEDWKTSRDALQRTMQKIASGYPAEPPFRQK